METAKLIIEKITEDVGSGKYDEHLNIPFMSRELILTSFEGKIQKKAETGATPILTDTDIKNCIQDAKEASATAFHLYEKFGFIEQKEDGSFEITKKGKLAIKHSMLM